MRLTGEHQRRGAMGTALAGFGLLFMGIGLLTILGSALTVIGSIAAMSGTRHGSAPLAR